MTNVKRTLSALLAVVMVFTTMTIAFTVIGSAAQIVPRVAATKLSPTVELTVPDLLQTFGSDYYSAGSNVKPVGEIHATITSPSGTIVNDVSLACSDAGVQLSARQQQGNSSVWTVQGGVLKTAPEDDGSTVVKWTISCTYGGKTYVTYAWSQVQPHHNNPGFAVYVRHKNSLSNHTTRNHHVEWIGPVYGDPATGTASNFYQCLVNESSAMHTETNGVAAASYYWNWDKGSGDDETTSSSVSVSGTVYADVSQVSTLTDIGLQSAARTHAQYENDGDHPQSYRGTSITNQVVNDNSSNAFSVTSTGSTEVSAGQVIGDAFSGTLPAAGGTGKINAEIEWEGQITRLFGFASQKSYHRTRCTYVINIVTYDKTALLSELNKVTSANYQAAHFRNTSPGSGYAAFKTWDEFQTALKNAWTVYSRVDTTQAAINAARTALIAAEPVYNSSGVWVSGMMYADADYSQIDTIISTIPETLDPDFYEAYSDGTYGKYYQYTLASALNTALEDIEDDRPLDARYQGVVDQMRANLSAAVTALVETPTKQTTKLVSIEFEPNQTGVTGMPASATTSLTGQFTLPTTSPSKQYYRFTGWSYDAEGTLPVNGTTIYVNPNSPNFKADLDVKNNNAGVAYTLYANWQVTGKTLTFDTQGGSEIPMAVGDAGESYAGPTVTPTKPGCSFAGWYTDTTYATPVDWSTFTFGTLYTVYAKWTQEAFTVTFNTNGGAFLDGTTTYTVTDLFGNAVTAPPPPMKTDAGFDGWYYDQALTQPVDMATFTIPSEDTTLFANWNEDIRNVVFYPQNGDEPIIRMYDIGGRVQRPTPDPTRVGYTFKGWYNNPNGTGNPKTFSFAMTNKNVVLYGCWNPLPFTVTFDAGEGTMPASFNAADYQNLPCGSVLVAPEEPILTDYVFAGWTLNGEPYTLSTVPAEDITLVATYVEEPYTATFRLRTDVSGTVEQGDLITATVSMTANRVVTNNRFIVYYDKNYFVPAVNGVAVTSAITGTSACSKIANRAYFTMVRNGANNNVTDCGNATGRVMAGIRPTTQWFPADWIVDSQTLKDEYSQYEFVYFDVADTSSGTRVRPNGEVDVASFQFLVRDDAPLANGTDSYAQLLLSPDFTRTSERTLGKTGAVLQADTTYTNDKNWDNTTNVVADGDHRFAVTQMQSCRINFITNGGSNIDAIEKAKCGRSIKLPTPTRDYYNFSGWTLTNDSADTNYVNANAYVVPNQDSITLYAKWTGKSAKYYIRHHKQNLDASGFLENYEQQQMTAPVGTSVTASPRTYPGFTCTNPGENGIVVGDTANLLILDLWYFRDTINITLDAAGGRFANNQETAVVSGLFDTNVTNVPANPTREGYTFDGWQYENAAYTFTKFPSGSITVTAKWTPKTVTVNFFINGSSASYASLTGQYGTPITAPTVAVNPGQVFSGWFSSSGEPFSYTTFPANDENFYGTVGIDGYQLTLYIAGVQYGQPIDVLNGTQVTEEMISYTADPGYRFTGWRTANSKDAPLAVFPMTLTANTALYGFTERETYSIRTYYYVDGELEDGPSVDNLFYGAAFDLPEPDDYTDSGYGFHGWYTDPELTTLYEKPATMPAQNIELYGEYYEMTGTVKFDGNGATSGRVPDDITVPVGETATLPATANLTRKYYTFGGWSTSKTGTTPITSYTFIGEEIITVYAIWKVNYAIVSFNLNGAETGTQPESMQVEIGEAIEAANLPSGADFTRTGYFFVGWSDNRNATVALESYTATSTSPKTLYAVWIADTVTLVAKEGSTTVIDNERGFIYGLKFNITKTELLESYLEVVGNGHLEFDVDTIGTGTVVNVINDYSGNIDATYTIVIFGDLNGDGMLNSTDAGAIRNRTARLVVYEAGSAQEFAADVTHDGMVNQSDNTLIRGTNARISTINQVPPTD